MGNDLFKKKRHLTVSIFELFYVYNVGVSMRKHHNAPLCKGCDPHSRMCLLLMCCCSQRAWCCMKRTTRGHLCASWPCRWTLLQPVVIAPPSHSFEHSHDRIHTHVHVHAAAFTHMCTCAHTHGSIHTHVHISSTAFTYMCTFPQQHPETDYSQCAITCQPSPSLCLFNREGV